MVFKSLLASLGIGGCTVDTILPQQVLYPGSFLEGLIRLNGGQVVQQIDRIDLILESVAEQETNDGEYKRHVNILRQTVVNRFSIEPQERKEIPFRVQIPFDTPITRVQGHSLRIPLALRTEIEVAGALNPSDRDPVAVEPHPAQSRILAAMDRLGLRFFKADLEYGQIRGARLPFFQEFEFKAGPHFHRNINEVELTFVGRERDMDVILEIDKKSSGWARLAYSSIDQVRGFTVRYDEWDKHDWESIIRELLVR